jgi:hypothetical protein
MVERPEIRRPHLPGVERNASFTQSALEAERYEYLRTTGIAVKHGIRK